MNNSTIAWKTRAQLDDFMVKMFHDFSKPLNKFIRDMVYGIQATGDTIITDIARAVAPEDKHRNVENRLSRNLQAEGLHEKIRDAVQADAVRFIDKNTLVIVDPTDVCKPHSYKMENLSLVRDASRSSKESVVTTRGYHGCMAVACKSGSRRTVPLDLRLWSSTAAGQEEGRQAADVAGMGRVVVPRRRIAGGRAKRRGVLRVGKPVAASVGVTCARSQRFCRGRAG